MTRYLTALLLCLPLSAASIYVATDGDDGGDGSIGSPYLTLEKARNVASAGDTVYLRGGTYYRTNTFELASTNSGLTFRGYPGETATLVGGLPLINWTVWSGSIYTTDVSTQGLSGINFRELYVNGARMIHARYPNFDSENPVYGGWLYAVGGSANSCVYSNADERGWTNGTNAQISVYGSEYRQNLVTISSINTNTQTISLAANADYSIGEGERFYVRGLLQELDAENEWCLDTNDSTLYVYKTGGLSSSTVIAPAVGDVISLTSGCSNVTIRNLQLTACTDCAVLLTDATNCAVLACSVRQMGTYQAVASSDAAISCVRGSGNRIAGNDISDVGGSAIYASGGIGATLSHGENVVENNWVSSPCRESRTAFGVRVLGVGNTVQHNTITNAPYISIYFSGNFHTIRENVVLDSMREADDGGAIYGLGGFWTNAWGCRVDGNLVSGSRGYGQTAYGTVDPWHAYGIYFDYHANGMSAASNVVTDVSGPGIHCNLVSWNRFTNNIVYGCGHDYNAPQWAVSWVGWPTNQSSWIAHRSNHLAGWSNIMGIAVWSNSTHALDVDVSTLGFQYGTNYYTAFSNALVLNVIVYTNMVQTTNSTWDNYLHFWNVGTNEGNFCDSNVVYHQAGGPIYVGDVDGVSRLTWAQWLASGEDLNSSTNDPLLDITNWQLDPASPALALGFQQIDTNWGCYYSSDRATWPLGQGRTDRILRAGTIRAGTLRGP